MKYSNDDLDFESILKDLDEEQEDEEKDLSSVVDDSDFSGYFDDAKISTKKRKTTFKPKKKKKQQNEFKIGEIVTFRNKKATIVFGPYERNYKILYEIQFEDGKIISASSTGLKTIEE
jgi:hypothetical protein